MKLPDHLLYKKLYGSTLHCDVCGESSSHVDFIYPTSCYTLYCILTVPRTIYVCSDKCRDKAIIYDVNRWKDRKIIL